MNSNCPLPFSHFLHKKECINSFICQNPCDNDKEICNDCNALFGKWRNGPSILQKVENKQRCPICFDVNDCYYRPFCNHFLCIQCFQKFLFGIQPNKPPFPYKNKEKLFISNPHLFDNDKSVQFYLQELTKYNEYIEKTSNANSKCFECCP